MALAALKPPLWFPIAVTASVFVVPVSAFKALSSKFSHCKTDLRELTDVHHLANLLQDLYELDIFSEVRFIEEFERNSIRLFNLWLHEQHQASLRVIENISATLEQLAQNMEFGERGQTICRKVSTTTQRVSRRMLYYCDKMLQFVK